MFVPWAVGLVWARCLIDRQVVRCSYSTCMQWLRLPRLDGACSVEHRGLQCSTVACACRESACSVRTWHVFFGTLVFMVNHWSLSGVMVLFEVTCCVKLHLYWFYWQCQSIVVILWPQIKNTRSLNLWIIIVKWLCWVMLMQLYISAHAWVLALLLFMSVRLILYSMELINRCYPRLHLPHAHLMLLSGSGTWSSQVQQATRECTGISTPRWAPCWHFIGLSNVCSCGYISSLVLLCSPFTFIPLGAPAYHIWWCHTSQRTW